MIAEIVLLLCILAISAYALYKIRKVHLALYRIDASIDTIKWESCHLFGQLQALNSLTELIKPRKPLPPLRGWAASPDFLLHVALHTLKTRPGSILECSSGASTIVLARCCEINGFGHILSLEHDAHFAEKTRALLAEHSLTQWATVIVAPLSHSGILGADSWYETTQVDTIPNDSVDLLVIDGPPQDCNAMARYPALPKLHHKLSSCCTIYLDDADRPDERVAVARWLEEFPRFSHTTLNAEKGCSMLWQPPDSTTSGNIGEVSVPQS